MPYNSDQFVTREKTNNSDALAEVLVKKNIITKKEIEDEKKDKDK